MTLKYLLKGGAKNILKCEKRIQFADMRGKRIGIDALIYMYRAINKRVDPIMYFRLIIFRLLMNGIVPIIAFDGKPSPKKRTEIVRRHNKKILNPNRPRLTYAGIIELKSTIISWGIQIETIDNYDAESFLCYLNRKGYIDYVASEDSDVIAYGATKWIRDIDTCAPRVIDIANFRASFGKSYSHWFKFLLLCVLIGTDYNDTISKFGKTMRKFGDRPINEIINDKIILDNMGVIKKSIQIFTHSFPEYDAKYAKLAAISTEKYLCENVTFPMVILCRQITAN